MKKTICLLAIITLAMSANGQGFLTNGLVSFYPFNGNANDAGGGLLNGIVQGAQATAGRVWIAAGFAPLNNFTLRSKV